jgi:ABC-type sugar transport system substrate-binding protein
MNIKRYHVVAAAALAGFSIAVVACGAPATVPTPQVIKETVVVSQEITKEVQVTSEVKVEVTSTPENVEFWTPEDVAKGTGIEQCSTLATLPKKFTQPWKIGFVGFNNAQPFHGAFQKGAADAAKFYGVEFVNMDAAGNAGAIIDLANTMMSQKVQALGVLGQGPDVYDPVAAAAQEQKITFIPADSGKSDYSPYTYGIPDSVTGKTGGELLVKGVKERQAADWKDKEFFFLEATYTSIPACVSRTGGAAKAVMAGLGLDDKHMIQLDGVKGNVSDLIKAQLTAHPNATFGLIPCWDQLGIDPYNVAREAKRGGDIMLVTLGGDQPPADLLVTKPQGYYGYVEFQPYCEGWGWTESALAILEGEQFQPYAPRRTTTQDTIEARYKELYGALPTPVPTASK